ncbi:MAG: trigger factor, partial [Defluviitaleaceae bacterium]|nr:trigger factor [Defluviitaleaceae bacterium]
SGGMPFNYYLQYSGQTMEEMRESTREAAEKHLTVRLALEAIAEKEKFEVSDEDIEAELTRISEVYQMTPDALRGVFGKKGIKTLKVDLLAQRAVDLVVETAVAKK